MLPDRKNGEGSSAHPGKGQFVRAARLLYFLAFTAVLVLLLYKCQYGFGNMDETFYLTVPYRFIQGDSPLLHEWHLSQFGLLTMVPGMWLYLQLVKTTDGIILAFRIIYTVLWSGGALFLYLRTRKIHEYGAMFASIMMQCYAPFSIMAFSYNSLGILYLINSVVFLLCAERHRKIQFALAGLFFAGAVLCCPYLLAVYALYTAWLGIQHCRKKRPVIPTNQADVFECWRFFTLGAAFLACIVTAVLLSGASPERLMKALTIALKDPDHANTSFLYKTGVYFQLIAASNQYFYPMLGAVILMTVLTLFRKRVIWFGIVCAAAVLYLRRFMEEYAYLNFLMLPLSFVGIYIMAVTRNSRIRWVGILWLVPGLFYTYCLNYSSSQRFYAISSAASVSSLASVLMMWMYAAELREEVRRAGGKGSGFARLAFVPALLCCVFQLRYEIPIRYQTVYYEAGLMKYEEQVRLEEGPERGLTATRYYADVYRKLYQDVRDLNHLRINFFSEKCWLYLINDNENCAYSSWIAKVDDFAFDWTREYYALNPEKIPDVIYLEKEDDRVLKRFDPEKFDMERTSAGNYLIRYRETE